MPLAPDVRGKDVHFEIHPRRVLLTVQGRPALSGTFEEEQRILHDECFWDMDEEGDQKVAVITLIKETMGHQSWTNLLASEAVDLTVTDRTFLEISINNQVVGKIVIGLFGKAAPKTVKNFRALCIGKRSRETGKAMSYLGTHFHRIIPGFMAQGGDFVNNDGSGGESIYGASFPDENFKVKHNAIGRVAMANSGPDSNSSQFYIIFEEQPHLDGKNVVFGQVEAGLDIVRQIEVVGTEDGTPEEEVEVTACGVLDEKEVATVLDENQRIKIELART